MDPDAIISLQKHTIDGLRADLARAADSARETQCKLKHDCIGELERLRARVADLEAAASLHWLTEEELKQSRARVAELEAALRDIAGTPERDKDYAIGELKCRLRARNTLARAESAAPKEVQSGAA